MTSRTRPTVAVIDLQNLQYNFRSCRAFLGKDTKIMAVVKANAYGHGAVECSKVLEAEGVDWLGVVIPEEAVQLRTAGISKPILCLGGFWPGQEGLLIEHNITPVIFEVAQAELINNAARDAGKLFPIHVKVDTGMGRLGVRWDLASTFALELSRYEYITVEGLMTHFASADDLAQSDFTDLQITRFHDALFQFNAAGHSPECIDLANSPGAVVNGVSGGNMVRLGGVLYGLGGDILPAGVGKPALKPVLSLVSSISHLKTVPAGESIGYGRTFVTQRPSTIAAVPIGYHDGYRRSFSNAAKVIIRGKFAPVVGRVSMDWIMVDVTDIRGIALWDKVTLIGSASRSSVAAEDLSSIAQAISYEITCGISSRVPRHFIGADGLERTSLSASY